MILRDIEIHTYNPSIKHYFNQETFHLCDLYLRLLNKYKTPETGKVVIRFEEVGKNQYPKKERNTTLPLIDIVEYYLDFDFKNYEKSNIEQKKKILWETICYSIQDIASQLNWSKEELKGIEKKGNELNLKNEFLQIKLK